jgi:hypothetical protein
VITHLEKLRKIYPDKKVNEEKTIVQPESERWKLDVQTEQVALTLPKAALDFYKFYAYVHSTTLEDELQLDILQKLKRDFEEMDFEELFGLSHVFEKFNIPNQIES